jgi:hypothetical protein
VAGGQAQVGFQGASDEPFALTPLAITTRAQGAPQHEQAPFALVPAQMQGSTRSGGKVAWCAPRDTLTDALQTERRLRVPPTPSQRQQGAAVASSEVLAALAGQDFEQRAGGRRGVNLALGAGRDAHEGSPSRGVVIGGSA